MPGQSRRPGALGQAGPAYSAYNARSCMREQRTDRVSRNWTFCTRRTVHQCDRLGGTESAIRRRTGRQSDHVAESMVDLARWGVVVVRHGGYGQAWPAASSSAISSTSFLQPAHRAHHDREADQFPLSIPAQNVHALDVHTIKVGLELQHCAGLVMPLADITQGRTQNFSAALR